MQPTITIRDIPRSAALEDYLLKKCQKLEKFHRRIQSCHVIVGIPQKHKHQGKLFDVHIDLTVPGKEVVVNRKQNEDVYVAIRSAFAAATRQLEQHAQKKRGAVKHHDTMRKGSVSKLFHQEGYGFIEDELGNEYYFSELTVPHFHQFKIGDTVFFMEVVTDDGLQASRVT